MSVTIPPPSDEIRQALQDGLGSFLSSNDPLRMILTGALPGRIRAPQMYALKLQDVAAGNVPQPTLTGTRFLAVGPDGDGIVVNVTAPAPGRPPRIGPVQRGPHVAKTLEALENVQPPGQSQDVQLSLLDIPGLLLESFWLKPDNGEDDWVVPYRTRIKLKLQGPYKLADLIEELKPLAVRRLEQDDGLETHTQN